MHTTYLLCIKIFIHIIIDAIVCTVFIKLFIFPQSTHFCCCCGSSLLWIVIYMREYRCVHSLHFDEKSSAGFFCTCIVLSQTKWKKKLPFSVIMWIFWYFSEIKQLTITRTKITFIECTIYAFGTKWTQCSLKWVWWKSVNWLIYCLVFGHKYTEWTHK